MNRNPPKHPCRMCLNCFRCMPAGTPQCPECGWTDFYDERPANKKEEHTTMDKFWMVVNVKERRKSHQPHSRELIPGTNHPTVLHLDEDEARAELLRLKTVIPTGEFVLMEAMGVAAPQPPVVTYTIEPLYHPVPF